MAVTGLLALLDDIATVLDDVALMSKVAAKKTVGLLGDDLALNAEQVSGVKASRELPVVWAVAKGSARNKLILVPLALLISAIAPGIITPILMLGGAYLCFEGFEKVSHAIFHSAQKKHEKEQVLQAVSDSSVDMLAFEKNKIKGAIRTDFILSAEIIVIALGTVKDSDFIIQLAVVSLIAAVMTIGVYSAVACIVKLDDLGFYLVKPGNNGLKQSLGKGILAFAPMLMKSLTIVGTAAMFLVGGGILLHGIPALEPLIHDLSETSASISYIGAELAIIMPILANALIGLVAGCLLVLMMTLYETLTKSKELQP